MPYSIKDNCINCDFCIEECPTACITPGLKTLVIDSDLCIECGICASVCPVDAVDGAPYDPEGQDEDAE